MHSKFNDESILLSLLARGEEQAYVFLVETYYRQLSNYALSLAKNNDTALDIVQNVFLMIWRDRKNLDKVNNLKNYLYKITYNQFIKQKKKYNSIIKLEHSFMETINQVIDDSSTELLDRKIGVISEGISKLPKRCKEIFLLSKKEGLTNGEIADYKNISIKTVEGHLTNAYKLLRETIGNRFEGIMFLLFRKIINSSNNI